MNASQDQRIAELEQQLAQMQKQLMQAEKMSTVGVLASSITHEFNNILTTVINYAKMGLRHKEDAMREKSFTKILAAGQRAAKITTGMLSYARSNGNRKEACELDQLIEDVLVLVEKDLQVHRISLVKKYQQTPSATVNANQIQQVILNLIINARQAMGESGTLTISLSENKAENFAEVSIRDTGCGIDAKTLPKIFNSFFTTKKADQAGQGGSGLGLAMCKEVIEDHHGRIRVESTPGKGTAFILKLPLAAQQSGFISTSKAG